MSEIMLGPEGETVDAGAAGLLSPVGPQGAPPKLRVPFEVGFEDGRIAIVDQDSEAELAQCVYAILGTEIGTQIDDPDLGITDQAFRQGGADLAELRSAVAKFEPRVNEMLTDVEWEGMVQRIGVRVG